jgi:hypothetical protein
VFDFEVVEVLHRVLVNGSQSLELEQLTSMFASGIFTIWRWASWRFFALPPRIRELAKDDDDPRLQAIY